MSDTITREKGRFVRDDTALRDGLIKALGIIKHVAVAWELFPDLTPEARSNFMDAVYRDISLLIEDLEDVDEKKGAKDEPATVGD